MSHFTTIKVEFKDQAALEAACKELCLPIAANQVARGYNGKTMKADYCIKCPGPYDIAVTKNKDGTLGLSTDWYQGHVAKLVGTDYCKLKQLYGIHRATNSARAKGYSVRRIAATDGSVKLSVTGNF